jgi:hypothetical protein
MRKQTWPFFATRETCTHHLSVRNILHRGVVIVITDTQERHLIALEIDANHTAISALPILLVCWYH